MTVGYLVPPASGGEGEGGVVQEEGGQVQVTRHTDTVDPGLTCRGRTVLELELDSPLSSQLIQSNWTRNSD